MKKALLVFIFIAFVFQLSAQQEDEIFFVVNGRLTTDSGKLDGATIAVSKNGERGETVTPPRSGRFDFNLEFNNEYQLTFNLAGCFQKIIIISTYVPDEILRKNNKFPPLPFVLNLFKEVEDLDRSFTIKPVARVFYNARIDNFDSEIYFSDNQLREMIKEAQAQNAALAAEMKNISKADQLEHAAREKEYDKAVAEADAFYAKKQFEAALEKFQLANSLFFDRPYPKDRIAEIQDLMAAMLLADEVTKSYQEAIREGDTQFGASRYDLAATAYQRALDIKPKDKYATDRLAESNRMLGQQEIDERYNQLIARADDAFISHIFDQAADLYTEAIGLKPRDSQYARDQLKRIEEERARLAQLASIEKQYLDAMAKGNSAFQEKSFNDALLAFNQALTIKPNDEPAQNRIRETEEMLRRLANEQNYAGLIAQADQLFNQNQLSGSKELYTQALAILPDQQYPKDRIAEIDRLLLLDQQFESLLSNADSEFDKQNYLPSKSLYQQVLQLKPEQEHAKNRITQIDLILQQQAHDEQYASLITEADRLFKESSWEPARSGYQSAIAIKPDEQYPLSQIAAINEILANRARIDQAYLEAIEAADQLAGREVYSEAIGKYREALSYKPAEIYPQEQIRRLNGILAQLETAKQLEASYLALIGKADSLFRLNAYQPSKNEFMAASALKPAEQYPKDRISEIDGILADLLRQQQELVQMQKAYEEAIVKADVLFKAEQLNEAKPAYQSALAYKPGDAYALQQISLIDEKLAREEADRLKRESDYQAKIALADQAFYGEKYPEAKTGYLEALALKPQEQYPAQQIEKIDGILLSLQQQAELDKQYTQYIADAEQAFKQEQYTESIGLFRNALALKPQESLPPRRIAEIEQIIAQREEAARIAAAAAQRLAEEEAKRAKYQEIIVRADNEFKNELYEPARTFYTEALGLFPDEQYPKVKLEAIANLLKQQELAELARKQKAQADSLARVKLEAFNQKIAEAETRFERQELNEAIGSYQEAILILPERTAEVNEKIKQVRDLISFFAQQESNYKNAISRGDRQFENQEWTNALTSYQQALKIKPEEAYPAGQIEHINRMLQEQQEAAARRLASSGTDDQYREAIKNADEHYGLKDYTVAQFYYYKASALQPQNQYPKDRIAEIGKLIDQGLEAGQLKAYLDAITRADAEYERKNYNVARFYYHNALGIKSWEQHPKDRIAEINKLTNSLLSVREEQEYQNLVSSGDEAFFGKNLAVARSYYQRAASIKKDEQYPAIKIAEIQKMMEQESLEQANREYAQNIEEADKAFTSANYSVARFYYNKALSLKPNENYPKEQLEKIRKTLSGN
ncbi:hypothetical protein [Gaoshiqia sp. Z1-71]|uniref:hypothetical protein n=1 Tax=Gaoshiqia hydrogeniformans TaxID=3290090 RepID=UPI003BF7EE97